MNTRNIPVLTDLVTTPPPATPPPAAASENLAELQARLITGSYALVERLLHEALQEMEANLFAEVIARLRADLPALVADTLQQHFDAPPSERSTD